MKTSFIKSVTDASRTPLPQLPWARGTKRDQTIARRSDTMPEMAARQG